MKIIKWFIRILFWLQAFAAPLILFGIIAFFVYSKGERYTVIAMVLLGIGVVSGVIIAEYIRRKIGLEIFFARMYGPNKMDKNEEPEKDNQQDTL